jgi:hypothetical protein
LVRMAGRLGLAPVPKSSHSVFRCFQPAAAKGV